MACLYLLKDIIENNIYFLLICRRLLKLEGMKFGRIKALDSF